MKKNILTILSVALTTAALTVLAFWSVPIEAGNEAQNQAPKVAQPKLLTNGIEMTLVAAEGKTFQAGDEPVFQLTAVNTTAEPATAHLRLVMDSISPASAMSRIGPVPAMIWHQDCTIALKPNEKKTMTVASNTKLPVSGAITVSMQPIDPNTPALTAIQAQAGKGLRRAMLAPSRVVALNFSTLPPASQPMLARAK
jgi:hypothetical protein